jgi:hypothetical protein
MRAKIPATVVKTYLDSLGFGTTNWNHLIRFAPPKEPKHVQLLLFTATGVKP